MSIINTNILDYGHYRVGDAIFYNKLDALTHHIKSKIPVTWHIFEDEISRIDLTVEPSETLEQLYAERARQLRNDYDHLVLHFSGGTDTAAIVKIFQSAGIKIDEIFVRTYGDHTNRNINDPETPEMDNLTIPVAKWVKDNIWPDAELTVVDSSKHIVDFFLKNPKWSETTNRSILDPTWQIRGDYDILNPSWQAMAEKGIKIAHIVGKEKPQLRKDDVGFYFYYTDTSLEAHLPARTLEAGFPHYVEMFFWHPKTLKMQLKQAHVLMREWDTCPIISRPDDLGFTRRYENEVARYIYGERTIPLPFQGLKMKDMKDGARYGVYLAQSQWFVDQRQEESTKIWLKGVFGIYDSVRDLYTDKMDFYRKGLPAFKSRKHYIRYHR